MIKYKSVFNVPYCCCRYTLKLQIRVDSSVSGCKLPQFYLSTSCWQNQNAERRYRKIFMYKNLYGERPHLYFEPTGRRPLDLNEKKDVMVGFHWNIVDKDVKRFEFWGVNGGHDTPLKLSSCCWQVVLKVFNHFRKHD